jgi:hypothetical protein
MLSNVSGVDWGLMVSPITYQLNGVFCWESKEAPIQRETKLESIYVIQTSVTKKQISTEDVVRNYKKMLPNSLVYFKHIEN